MARDSSRTPLRRPVHPDQVIVEYTVTATQTELGWGLRVDGIGVVRVLTLDQAECQVRAMIETASGVKDSDSLVVRVIPE